MEETSHPMKQKDDGDNTHKRKKEDCSEHAPSKLGGSAWLNFL